MATFGEALAAIRPFRNELAVQAQFELQNHVVPLLARRRDLDLNGAVASPGATFAAPAGIADFSTPLSNVHATGVGVRTREGKPVLGEFVLKVYVFERPKLDSETPTLLRDSYHGVPIDIEHLPIQQTRAKKQGALTRAKTKGKGKGKAKGGAAAQHVAAGAAVAQHVAVLPGQRQRIRQVVGGLSAAPLGTDYVGTVGGFLRGFLHDTERIYALSNAHVFADVDKLPPGTLITQPGPETASAMVGDVFATLTHALPIQFPGNGSGLLVSNFFDAAIAMVTDKSLIQQGKMYEIPTYNPELLAPVPGMRVIKMGRTTGRTSGTIHAIGVNGVRVNYGSMLAPRITVFNDTIEIVGDGPDPFSRPGDSGSFILEEATGRPVALLFAGDRITTTACDLGGVCRQFQAFPI